MGRMSLEGMLEQSLDMRVALEWHLTSNHYPPVPINMVEPCLMAIGACNWGEPDFAVDLPDGITWRGNQSAPAWAIVEGHHLESFLESSDD